MDFYPPFVVVPNNPINHLGDRHMLGFRLGFYLLDERFFDVQGPALGRGGGVIRLGQQVLAPAPPEWILVTRLMSTSVAPRMSTSVAFTDSARLR